jgi:hypothetical protein
MSSPSARTLLRTYERLYKFIKIADTTAAQHGLPKDHDIDEDFRSGVCLGMGLINIIFSLIPKRLLTLLNFMGYSSDQMLGLELLYEPGGWRKDDYLPTMRPGRLW